MQSETMIRKQIEAVKTKSMPELLEQFHMLFGFECGRTSIRHLRNRIIYRLQEIYYGGVDEVDMAFLIDIANNDPLANLKAVEAKLATKVKGTKLYRVWKGKQYEVTVGSHGKYIYQGEIFRSLSAVARKITGTKWNGKVFFGVKN